MDQDQLVLQNHRLLQDVSLQTADADRQVLQRFALSPARYFALNHIAQHGELLPSTLCQLMLCDKANVTRLLDGLEHDGLVMRERDQADGRRMRVTLTEAGQVRWHAANEARNESVRQRLAGLSVEDHQTLNRLLSMMIDQLGEYLAGLAMGARS